MSLQRSVETSIRTDIRRELPVLRNITDVGVLSHQVVSICLKAAARAVGIGEDNELFEAFDRKAHLFTLVQRVGDDTPIHPAEVALFRRNLAIDCRITETSIELLRDRGESELEELGKVFDDSKQKLYLKGLMDVDTCKKFLADRSMPIDRNILAIADQFNDIAIGIRLEGKIDEFETAKTHALKIGPKIWRKLKG